MHTGMTCNCSYYYAKEVLNIFIDPGYFYFYSHGAIHLRGGLKIDRIIFFDHL